MTYIFWHVVLTGEVRRCPLRLGTRRARSGAAHSARELAQLSSGAAHCNLELPEVRRCPLQSGAPCWGPALPTAICSSLLAPALPTAICSLQCGNPALPIATYMLAKMRAKMTSKRRRTRTVRRRRRRRRMRKRTVHIKSNNPGPTNEKKFIVFAKQAYVESSNLRVTVCSELRLSILCLLDA